MIRPSTLASAMGFNSSVVVAIFAGIIAHVSVFKRGEWHMEAPQILICHVLLFLIIVLLEHRMQAYTIFDSASIITGYVFGLYSSIVAYRLSPSHRLNVFPGPKLAAVSKLWHVWQCRDSRNHELMHQLYHEYGDFVRIGKAPWFVRLRARK